MTGDTQQPPTHASVGAPDEAPASVTQRLTAASQKSAEAVQRFAAFAAHTGSPKLRAIALIGSLSLLVITVVCAPFGALPWWSPILMLAVSGGVFWWCRVSTVAAAAGERPSAQAAHQAGPARLPRRTTTVAAAPADVALAKATMPEPVVQAPAAADDRVFDLAASDTAPAAQRPTGLPRASVAPTPVAEKASDEWQPVAVPRPTYTMKERAPQRPQHAAAPTSSTRSYDDVPNEDLPFDGLALDQDLDDLPSVFRAG